jgi:hypothetical protein
MSIQLQALLLGNGEDLEPDMRPDRIGGGRLVKASFVIDMGDDEEKQVDAGCLAALYTETSAVSKKATGQLETDQARTFLHWMANGLDVDRPVLDLEVISADGTLRSVEGPARRLTAKAFG